MSESSATTLSAAVDMPEFEGAYKRHICRAISSGDWVEASSYDTTHPNWVCTPLTEDEDTALHIAVSLEQPSFVDKLAERMSKQDMEILNADGNTAFCMASISGNVEIAAILLDKNPGLVWIRGHNDMLPIQLASSAGQTRMVKFLFETIHNDMHIIPFEGIVKLFFLALTNSIYIVASSLLETYPEIASAEDGKGLTALEILAQLSFDGDAPGYRDILSSLFEVMEEEEFPNSARTREAMFDAAKSGNVAILEFILTQHPNLLMKVNSKGQSLLHIAVLYRQVTVYRLILSKGAYKNAIMQVVDCEGNNVLHLAGKLAAEGRFGPPIHQVLISCEELWFKGVEKIVPASLKIMKNREGWTPEELFFWEHRELFEKAISELNGVASSFLVAGTLVLSLGLTAALTIPTGNYSIQRPTPFFGQKLWYIICLLSLACGISGSAVSTLLITSIIVPSIWRSKRDYVNSRLMRMTRACLLLYASIGIMATISITSGAVLIYNFLPIWIFCVIALLCAVPSFLSFVIYDCSFQLSTNLMQLRGLSSTSENALNNNQYHY